MQVMLSQAHPEPFTTVDSGIVQLTRLTETNTEGLLASVELHRTVFGV